MLFHEQLELSDQVGVAAEREIRLQPLLEREEAKLLEACTLAGGERLGGELREGRPAPEAERSLEGLAGGRGPTFRQASATLLEETLEDVQVELAGIDLDRVPVRSCGQDALRQRLPQA